MTQQPYHKQIYIFTTGRSGNQLFQYLLAIFFQRCVPHAEICCNSPLFLTELGVNVKYVPIPRNTNCEVIVVDRHDMDMATLITQWTQPIHTTILIVKLVCRMELFFPLRNHYQHALSNIFDADPTISGWDASKLVINIRLEDILSEAIHPNYPPLPFSFYRWILCRTQLEPVFLGQLGNDRISKALRSSFPDAIFCPSQGTRTDFEVMRRSRHVLTSVSTFSYLACFLSKTCTSIHVPLYGFFNPEERPDCNFLANDDQGIFHYYHIPKMTWKATDAQIDEIIDMNNDGSFHEIKYLKESELTKNGDHGFQIPD